MSNKLTLSIKDDGINIPADILKKAGFEKELDIIINKNTILLKSKSFSNKLRGIIKNTPLSINELENLYDESRIEK